MARTIGGLVAGIVVMIISAMIISYIGGFLVTAPPVAMDMSDPNSIKSAYAELGVGAQLLGVLAWTGGALLGAIVAKRMIGRPWAAWTVAGLAEAYMLISILVLPMSGWMQVVALLLPIAAGFLANHLVKTRIEPDDGAEEGAPSHSEL